MRAKQRSGCVREQYSQVRQGLFAPFVSRTVGVGMGRDVHGTWLEIATERKRATRRRERRANIKHRALLAYSSKFSHWTMRYIYYWLPFHRVWKALPKEGALSDPISAAHSKDMSGFCNDHEARTTLWSLIFSPSTTTLSSLLSSYMPPRRDSGHPQLQMTSPPFRTFPASSNSSTPRRPDLSILSGLYSDESSSRNAVRVRVHCTYTNILTCGPSHTPAIASAPQVACLEV